MFRFSSSKMGCTVTLGTQSEPLVIAQSEPPVDFIAEPSVQFMDETAPVDSTNPIQAGVTVRKRPPNNPLTTR